MLSTNLSKGFDEFLFGIPLIVLLFVGFFRLDEVFTKKSPRNPSGPPAPEDAMYQRTAPKTLDPRRASPMSDPDGRPWEPRVRKAK